MPVIVKVPVSRFAGGLRTVGVIAAHVQITATDGLFVVTGSALACWGDESVKSCRDYLRSGYLHHRLPVLGC